MSNFPSKIAASYNSRIIREMLRMGFAPTSLAVTSEDTAPAEFTLEQFVALVS